MIWNSAVLEAVSRAAIEASTDWINDHYPEDAHLLPRGYFDCCREIYTQVLIEALTEGAEVCAQLPSPREYADDADEQDRVDAAMGDR